MRTNHNLKNGRAFGLPTSTAGRWAIVLEMAFIACFALLQLMVLLGERGGETFFANLWLATTVLAGGGAAIAGGVLAAFAILRRHERSLLVVAAGLIGGLVLFFLAGELLIPH